MATLQLHVYHYQKHGNEWEVIFSEYPHSQGMLHFDLHFNGSELVSAAGRRTGTPLREGFEFDINPGLLEELVEISANLSANKDTIFKIAPFIYRWWQHPERIPATVEKLT